MHDYLPGFMQLSGSQQDAATQPLSSRSSLFVDLRRRGFFVTPCATSVAGDWLVYTRDPLRHHAEHIVSSWPGQLACGEAIVTIAAATAHAQQLAAEKNGQHADPMRAETRNEQEVSMSAREMVARVRLDTTV
jgi:hypothetical protein